MCIYEIFKDVIRQLGLRNSELKTIVLLLLTCCLYCVSSLAFSLKTAS